MDAKELDFAYKYPFSSEAKDIIKNLGIKSVDNKYIAVGKSRLEEALENEKLEYRPANYGKEDHLVGYVYARMLVSALKNISFTKRYAKAEAKRSVMALDSDSVENMMKVCKELDFNVKKDGENFVVGFAEFLTAAPNDAESSLVNQKLHNGMIVLDKNQLAAILESVIAKSVEVGLPISAKELPKLIVDTSKTIKLPIQKELAKFTGKGSIGWIERLLQTPIADCRHRTVNLILAPYLVNIKGMPVDTAVATIVDYINRCKVINPNTNITERYIKYQCNYAKSHTMRPLALAKARIELGSGIDFDYIAGKEVA